MSGVTERRKVPSPTQPNTAVTLSFHTLVVYPTCVELRALLISLFRFIQNAFMKPQNQPITNKHFFGATVSFSHQRRNMGVKRKSRGCLSALILSAALQVR